MTYLVTIYGKNDSHRQLLLLLKLLERANISYMAIDSKGHIHRAFNDTVKVIITETDTEASLTHSGDILIIKNHINNKIFSFKEKDFCTAIISDDTSPHIHDADKEQKIITCGTHQKSSVTVSSNIDEHLCVFIQRKLHKLSGEVLEPQEFTLPICEDITAYEIMAAAICLILLS